VINKSICTQIRQAKLVYIYTLYIHRHVYTYRLALTFSAMSIYTDYICKKERGQETLGCVCVCVCVYSMQIRQAKSVYIHLDYIYLSVQYASQNMSTSFRAVGLVMMQRSRLGDDAKDESCYAYEYRSTNSHMSFWGLCKRYVTRLYLHIIICLHTTICLHVSVHVYIQHMFPSFVT